MGTKWKPGESGNPLGQRRHKPFTDALIWAASIAPNEAEKRKGKTMAQAAALAVLKKARAGDVPAFNSAADRVEGKPAQAIAITDETDNTLRLDSYPTALLRDVASLLNEAAETGELLAIAAPSS